MRERQSDPSNQLPWQQATGGREGRMRDFGGGGRGGGSQKGCGEVGAGRWQNLTLKHEGKAARGLVFHREGKKLCVCICVL